MKLYHIIHTMLAQKSANAIKIISVAVGLLVSTLVFSRLDYNYSYDTCFPDRDRLYQIWMEYNFNGEPLGPFTSCPGKIAEGIVEALGQDVSAATAIGRIYGTPIFEGNRRIDIPLLAIDSTFFATMGIEVIQGNPIADFTAPDVIYLDRSTARKLYGDEDPIGKTLSLNHEATVTVRGIFADLPVNVTVDNFKGLVSQRISPHFERRRQWGGADNWPIYFRVSPDCNLSDDEINSLINRMYQTHNPDTDDSKTIISARPISDTYLELDSVKRMNLILWILGSALLLMTTLNYVLITIASLSRRAKAIGVHKCSGAGTMTVMGMFLSETAIILICSLAVMILLLFIFEPLITDTLSISIADIVEPRRLWIPLTLLAFFFLVGGLLPGRIFSLIPVTQVFRRFTERNSAWKRSLLFIQIAGIAFIASLLVIVTMQYREVINRDMGFSTERLAYISIPGAESGDAFKATLTNLPYVEEVAASSSLPLWGYSGEMVFDAKGAVLFNTRIEWTDKGYLKLMKIPLIAGREPNDSHEMMISEEFARRIGKPGASAVGSTIHVGGGNDNSVTVTGIFGDYILSGFTSELTPICISPTEGFGYQATLRLKAPFKESYAKLLTFLEDTYPSYDFSPVDVGQATIELYKDVRMFRNSALIATITLIFISLMGLIGFTRDEVQRRSKEIAIRKVNGAEPADIIGLLIADILRIVIPAVIIGTLCAAYVGHIWLANFSIAVDNLWLCYTLAALSVVVLVILCVLSITIRVATENPVNRLKSE
ncbi:MAG: hypothetical protein NC212_05020 [Staphylococcus sp.]|nr:hypothetical protein [Staphylococcus sp.]